MSTADERCWTTIGVHGDRSCPELATHVHCHHCPVFAGGARRSLQQPVPPGYRAEWAARLRASAPPAPDTSASVLGFRLGGEWLALPTATCLGVAPAAPAHRLPHRGGALLGLVNADGRLLPAVDLAALLGGVAPAAPPAPGTVPRPAFPRLLVFAWKGAAYAIPAAELHGVVRHAPAALLPPAASMNRGAVPFLAGVLPAGELSFGVLDPARVGAACARLVR
ncbi:MAG: chemotaxis protein CheW [Telluria sp.]